MIKVNDFVIISEKYKNVEPNSVGFVENISSTKAKVFFIGMNQEITLNLNKLMYLDVNQTGKPYRFKICNVCHILKEDFKDFDINQTDAKGRKTTRPTCTECRKNIDGLPINTSERRKMMENRPDKFSFVLFVKNHQFLLLLQI